MQVLCSHQEQESILIILGLKIFEDIEERYNNPTEEMIDAASSQDQAGKKCLKSGN